MYHVFFFFNLASCNGKYSSFSPSCNRRFGGGLSLKHSSIVSLPPSRRTTTVHSIPNLSTVLDNSRRPLRLYCHQRDRRGRKTWESHPLLVSCAVITSSLPFPMHHFTPHLTPHTSPARLPLPTPPARPAPACRACRGGQGWRPTRRTSEEPAHRTADRLGRRR